MLRVAFLGAGSPLSVGALQAVAARHAVVAVIEGRPRPRGGALAALLRSLRRGRSELSRLAAALEVPYRPAHRRSDAGLAGLLRTLRPDVMCIAAYPWILPASLFTIPARGALNLHTSLLPRHRGAQPLFWLYHADNRDAGVTVHRVTERADAGDIVLQTAFPLRRGCPIAETYARCGELGASLLATALDAVENDRAPRVPQDERLATAAPFVPPGTPMVAFASWDVERVWHFLVGLWPVFREPLTDAAGQAVRYQAVTGYVRADHGRPPGSLTRSGNRVDLYCLGGIVHLEAAR